MTRARAAVRSRLVQVLVGIVGALVGISFLLPLLWALTSSLRPNGEIFRYLQPIQWGTFFSEHFSLSNYAALLATALGQATINSLVVSAVTVVVGLAICSTAAFGLSAITFRGQSVVFAIVILSFLIPFDAIAIPLANMFRVVELQNTFTGLILPGLGNGVAIFLLRQFFLAIPPELVEAGRIDGLGWWGVFWRIYLPLSVPAMIGAGLTLFLFQWQSFVWPLLIGTDSEHLLGPIALANFQGQFHVDFGIMFAGAIVLTVIPLVIILSLQRYFIQSVTTTGLK
jgi:putative chitobiose transport system permease protein